MDLATNVPSTLSTVSLTTVYPKTFSQLAISSSDLRYVNHKKHEL